MPKRGPNDGARRSHTGRQRPLIALTLVAAAGILASAVAACSPTTTASVRLPDYERTAVSEPTSYYKVCLDGTTSSAPAFAQGIRADLVAALNELAQGTWGATPTAQVPARPGLQLWLQTVTTHSFADDGQPEVYITIPGVPALPAPPAYTDPNFAADELTWAKAEASWAKAVAAARAAGAKAANQLRSVTLDQGGDQFSAIWACMAALADTGPQGPDVKMLLASDGINNEPPVTASYAGAPVMFVVNCAWGSELGCPSRAAAWVTGLRRQGSGPVTVVRADWARPAIDAWFGVSE